MSRRRPVKHFEEVDLQNLRSCFFEGRNHRAFLQIPFLGDRGSKTLCVIGQNPSTADEIEADKTIRYLEELIFRRFVEYRQIIVLNLYSQVDTTKTEEKPPLHAECSKIFTKIISEENDFLVIFGKLGNQQRYRFLDRVKEIQPLLRSKRILKIDIGTAYAPHPGNPNIIYSNFDVGLGPYCFADIS